MSQSDSASLSAASSLSAEWFAFRVRPRHEKLVALQLGQKRIRCFMPISRQNRYWARRLTVVELPVFPGFVFASVPRADLHEVLGTRGVIDVVRTGTAPCVVPADEIGALDRVTGASGAVKRSGSVPTGELVTVLEGPFAGVTGWVDQKAGQEKLLLPLTVLQCSLEVDLAPYAFAPVHSPYGSAMTESCVTDAY